MRENENFQELVLFAWISLEQSEKLTQILLEGRLILRQAAVVS